MDMERFVRRLGIDEPFGNPPVRLYTVCDLLVELGIPFVEYNTANLVVYHNGIGPYKASEVETINIDSTQATISGIGNYTPYKGLPLLSEYNTQILTNWIDSLTNPVYRDKRQEVYLVDDLLISKGRRYAIHQKIERVSSYINTVNGQIKPTYNGYDQICTWIRTR